MTGLFILLSKFSVESNSVTPIRPPPHLHINGKTNTNYAKTAQFVSQVSATPAHHTHQCLTTLFSLDSPRKNHPKLTSESSTVIAESSPERVGESITVRVICPSSRVLVFKTDINKRLTDLKSEVILELSDDPDSIQLFAPDVRHLNPRYRLYRAEYFGSEPNDLSTLAQLGVRHNDTFILSPRRTTLPSTLTRTREVPGPNDALMETATRFVPNNMDTLPIIDINEIFQQSNVSCYCCHLVSSYLNQFESLTDSVRCAKSSYLSSTCISCDYWRRSVCSAAHFHVETTSGQST